MKKYFIAGLMSLAASQSHGFLMDGRYQAEEGWTTGFEVTYVANGNDYVGGYLAFGEDDDGQYLYIAAPRTFVDNSYGANAVGWSGNHNFNKLLKSDSATFTGQTQDDGELSIKLDLIGRTHKNDSATDPDNYGSGGIGKHDGPGTDIRKNNDGAVLSGNQQAVDSLIEVVTSTEYNINEFGDNTSGLDVLTDSPDVEADYSNIQEGFDNWIFEVGYELMFAKGTFDTALWNSEEVDDVTSLLSDFAIHASNSKSGQNNPDEVLLTACSEGSDIPACSGSGGGGGGSIGVPVPAPLLLVLAGLFGIARQRRHRLS